MTPGQRPQGRLLSHSSGAGLPLRTWASVAFDSGVLVRAHGWGQAARAAHTKRRNSRATAITARFGGVWALSNFQ